MGYAFGIFPNVPLFINITLIISLLSVLQATLTLPGIAGIVLTVGMAVDANVLVFERIKEEIRSGRSIINSIDLGYKFAVKTILDANFTTLIAAMAGNVGVQSSAIIVQGLANDEIKGSINNRLFKETLLSILNGVILAGLLFLFIYFWKGEIDVALALSIALVAVVIVAGIIGTFIPLFLNFSKTCSDKDWICLDDVPLAMII